MSTPPQVPPAKPRPRAVVYIDGFNFYYGAIKDTPHKWLDLQGYAERLLNEDDVLYVRYITSIMVGASSSRQAVFLNALSTRPKVKTVLGQFKNKSVQCTHGGCTYGGERIFQAPEEKRTDVGIAVQMVDDAYQNVCDKLVLISGDSDLVPAVQLIRRRFPAKKILVYTPTREGDSIKDRRADELTRAAGDGRRLPIALLPHCYLPETVIGRNGAEIKKPSGW